MARKVVVIALLVLAIAASIVAVVVAIAWVQGRVETRAAVKVIGSCLTGGLIGELVRRHMKKPTSDGGVTISKTKVESVTNSQVAVGKDINQTRK